MAGGMSLAAFAEGFANSRQMRKDSKERDQMRAMQERMMGLMERNMAAGGANSDTAPAGYGIQPGGMGALPDQTARAGGAGGFDMGSEVGLFDLLDQREGGGSYDTLYGYANKKGPFAGTRVSNMTLGEAMEFSRPDGPYAQHVKSQIGRVATPMGRGQIVGTTLRNTAKAMGLDPSTPFNRETQDSMINYLASQRLRGAGDMAGKMKALRSEWEGFGSVPDQQLAQAITNFERKHMGSSRGMGALPPLS